MARADKAAAVAELTTEFNSSNGAVLTEYRGLTVAQLGELRRNLGDNAKFAVVKNTLTKLAVRDAGVDEGLSELLEGPSAIAFVKGDVVEAAKGLRDFSRAHPLLVIKGGVIDGKPMTPDEISKLADLESREVLLAKLAGAMKASMANTASVLNALPTQLAQLAEALRVKREEAGETSEAAEGEAGEQEAGEQSAAGQTSPAGQASEAPAEETKPDEG